MFILVTIMGLSFTMLFFVSFTTKNESVNSETPCSNV
jgi:hypothetical protein